MSDDLESNSDLNFSIDTNPADDLESNTDLNFSIDTNPVEDLTLTKIQAEYKIDRDLQVVESTVGVDEVEKVVGYMQLCWNCNGKHNLRDCKEPRNFRNISSNKRLFQNNKNSNLSQVVRYHEETDQKYSHIKPGKISRKLRTALGLKSKSYLPQHIYMMRMLGYPPAWLLEAEINNSGIDIMDSSGTRVPEVDEEDGEIRYLKRTKFDIDKIIEFPGFNVIPKHAYNEECKTLCMPPVNPMQSKDALAEYLNNTFNNSPSNNDMSMNINEFFSQPKMDIDNSDGEIEVNPPLPKEKLPPLPAELPPLPEEKLPPLPEEKLPPLPEEKLPPLPEEELPPKSPNSPLEESLDSSNINDSKMNDSISSASLNETNINENDLQNDSVLGVRTPNIAVYNSLGKMTDIQTGTPVLNVAMNLPSSEKFSKNISPVIDFENLPDSLGNYEKMKGVLNKVRNRLSI